ncbi:hypothetical protein, partial [Pseudomonas sp. 2995-3]|uniref:hypothetical protein n=1 Tax=Pseudomonas sp. 2995-3 TaxID=1712680 RepID=UPI001C4653A1
FRRGKNLQDEGHRLEYIQKVLKEITNLKHAVERDHYLRQLSEEFTISLEALKQEQIQIFKSQSRNDKREEFTPNQKTMSFPVQKKLL